MRHHDTDRPGAGIARSGLCLVATFGLLLAVPAIADMPLQDRGPYNFRVELSEQATEALARGEIMRQSTFDIWVRFDCPTDDLWSSDYQIMVRAVGAGLVAEGVVPIDSNDSSLEGAVLIPVNVAALCPEQAPLVPVTVTIGNGSAVGIEAQLHIRGQRLDADFGSGLFLAVDRSSEGMQKRGAGAFLAEQMANYNVSDATALRRQVADRVDELTIPQFDFTHPDDQPSMRVDLQTGAPR